MNKTTFISEFTRDNKILTKKITAAERISRSSEKPRSIRKKRKPNGLVVDCLGKDSISMFKEYPNKKDD